ncbi:uncharacterized protein [Periplaneta americana]|uniref:uncharacterized protein isoform X2 n=1 Tax=Periplaneta americana TaxID=6978 RepID=UPI0037E8C8AC
MGCYDFCRRVGVMNFQFNGTASSNLLFLAATIPLEQRDEITLVWFFEANYHVPEYSLDFFSGNETSRMSRDLDRRRIYVMLENAFYRYGYDGRECLLKCICETSNTPLHNKTGLLGDLLRILFTPSSSLDEELSPAFQVAEERGRNHEACDHAYPNCSIGLMDISTIL